VPLVTKLEVKRSLVEIGTALAVLFFVKSNLLFLAGSITNKFINLLVNIYFFDCRIIRICVDL
jgi:hypothetical protein